MPAGLQVFNDWGTIQVDQNYISFSLSAKGTLPMTLDPETHPQPMRIGQVTVTGQNPIIAFLPPNGGLFSSGAVNLLARRQNGNQFTFYFRAKSNSNFTLSYWVFDSTAYGLGAGQGFGLQIFKENGALAFDSGTKPIRVTGVIDLTPSPDGGGSITVPAGRTYALVQGSFAYGVKNVFDGWVSMGGDMEGAPDEGGDPGAPPPNAVGQYMDCRTYHSAGYSAGGLIHAGYYEFEQFRGQDYIGAPDREEVWGDIMFWTVDVTGY